MRLSEVPVGRRALFFSFGFSMMVAQIVIVRESINTFGGNELVAGAVLAGWLFFSAVGDLLAFTFMDKVKRVELIVAISLSALACLIPLTSMSAMLAKTFLGIAPPIMPGIIKASLAALLMAAPLGLLLGISFAAACRISDSPDSEKISDVYAYDALGSAIGGAVFSLIFIGMVTALTAAISAGLVLVVALCLVSRDGASKIISAVACALLTVSLIISPKLNAQIVSIKWKGYNPVVERETKFSSLMITANGDERTLFTDGRPSFTLPLPESYKTITNLPLVQDRTPRDIAVVGGGVSGIVDELAPWGVHNAYFVRLDPEVTKLETDDMPSGLGVLPDFAHIIEGDGRNIISEGIDKNCRKDCLDVLIINAADPDTASAARYFTSEFFHAARKILHGDGVLMLSALEPGNAIGANALKVLGTIKKTLDENFKKVIVLPFDRFYFLASDDESYLTDDIATLQSRAMKRGLTDSYFGSVVLAGIFQERIDDYKSRIDNAAKEASITSDAYPSVYLNDMILLEERGEGADDLLLSKIYEMPRPAWILIALGILAAFSGFTWKSAVRRCAIVSFALGFSSMSSVVTLLIYYQITHGILVYKIGLLLTSFMVGAWVGSGVMSFSTAIKRRSIPLPVIGIATSIYILFLLKIAGLDFMLANFALGTMSGLIYRAASSSAAQRTGLVGKSAGIIDGADRFGAAVGAIMTSIIFIPVLGIDMTLEVSAGLLALAAIISAAIKEPGP
jgi:spermidine synthase